MAGNRIKGITIEIGGDTTGLKKALSEVDKSLNTTQSALKDVNRLLKLDPKNTELLAQKHGLLKEAIAETKERLDALKNADVQAKKQLENGELGKDKYDALQREIIETEEKLKSLKKTIGSGSAALASISAQTEKLSKKSEKLAKAIKPVSTAVAAIGAASVKLASDFEEGMDEVLAISGATEEQFEKLKEKAIEMGAKTKFSAGESAEAFKYMAMAGWDTDEMLNSIAGIMDLAAASGEDLGTTSDIVTDAMTAFGMAANETSKVLKDGLVVEVSNATRFADVLAKASSKSNTNVALMGETFQYVAPVAGALGYSIEDVSVAIGLMANSGIKASQAGTALRTLMTNMAKPSEEMANAMNVLGVSLEDSQGNMLSFKEVMEKLREGFGDIKIPKEELIEALSDLNQQLEDGTLSETKYNESLEVLTTRAYGAEGALKAKYAAMLAGKTGMSGLLAIMNATDEEFQSLTNEIYNASGATAEMAATMMDNTAGAFEQLKGALESAAIVIGEKLSPYIRKLAEFITELVEKFSSLSDQQLDFIVKAGMFVAALAPALKIVSSVSGAISNLTKIMSKDSITMSLVTKALELLKSAFSKLFALIMAHPVIAVVTVIIGAIVLLYNKCEWFRNGVNAIINNVVTFFKNLGTAITVLKDNAIIVFGDMINGIKTKVSNIASTVKNGFQGAINFITSLPSKALGWGKDFMQGMINGIKAKINGIVSAVKGVANKIASYLHFSRPDEGPLHYYEEWMPDFLDGLAKGINKNAYKVNNAVKNLASGIETKMNVYSEPTISNISVSAPAVTVMVGNKQFDGYIVKTAMKGINHHQSSILKAKGMA